MFLFRENANTPTKFAFLLSEVKQRTHGSKTNVNMVKTKIDTKVHDIDQEQIIFLHESPVKSQKDCQVLF